MSQAELLAEAIAALDSADVGYVLTGSLVSSLQGEPRATHDVDIVIEVDFRAVERLAVSFGAPRYYFDETAARVALGHPVYVTTPEDTILQKLKWARDCGGSERQLRDAVGIYELQNDGLDERYLEDWAARLGVVSLLEKTRSFAEEASRDR